MKKNNERQLDITFEEDQPESLPSNKVIKFTKKGHPNPPHYSKKTVSLITNRLKHLIEA